MLVFDILSKQKIMFGKQPKKPLIVYGEGHLSTNKKALSYFDSIFSRRLS